MGNSVDKHAQLERAHLVEIEDWITSLSEDEQDVDDRQGEGKEPADGQELETYEASYPATDYDFDDTDPGLNVFRLGLDPEADITVIPLEELILLNGYSRTFIPEGEHGERDVMSIPEPPTIGSLKRTPFGETTLANLEWYS